MIALHFTNVIFIDTYFHCSGPTIKYVIHYLTFHQNIIVIIIKATTSNYIYFPFDL